ncbi:unnamed protein product [Aureobasidium vineae]|uniref:Large ribosomal subunit protein mL49 n=1 Tax=Aureobasidium vineae TaxID=2773715 RepID=A0A9N8JAI3_9PEZI|nr:unnamed protein product [Aureobasidium vineae]
MQQQVATEKLPSRDIDTPYPTTTMSFLQPVMPSLRLLAVPRSVVVRQCLRFSTSTIRSGMCLAHFSYPRHVTNSYTDVYTPPSVDPNLVASRTASPSYPPTSLKSIPRPLTSHASHRTSQPTKIRNYPDRQLQKDIPVSEAPALPESEIAPNLPYFVTRTPSNELPIYTLRKRGGNMKLTRVKKIDGNIDVLRDALQIELGVPDAECVINRLTNHVMIKGWHKPRIEAFLKARNF